MNFRFLYVGVRHRSIVAESDEHAVSHSETARVEFKVRKVPFCKKKRGHKVSMLHF